LQLLNRRLCVRILLHVKIQESPYLSLKRLSASKFLTRLNSEAEDQAAASTTNKGHHDKNNQTLNLQKINLQKTNYLTNFLKAILPRQTRKNKSHKQKTTLIGYNKSPLG
jgi:hypothetical protein